MRRKVSIDRQGGWPYTIHIQYIYIYNTIQYSVPHSFRFKISDGGGVSVISTVMTSTTVMKSEKKEVKKGSEK